jgi:hypothetical protein
MTCHGILFHAFRDGFSYARKRRFPAQDEKVAAQVQDVLANILQDTAPLNITVGRCEDSYHRLTRNIFGIVHTSF